ncbi:hypothetical protein ACJVC5_04415 [Peredibacter sp. HCB2-198]|uniref:hypothetical protein n=1 Tax=Peredibacter sp. HCB2-198 TaxID=3383025 RepID=UPI0038B54EAE
MKRLKLVFAIVILLFALPIWRFIDFVAIFSPFEILTSLALFIWFGLFVAIPVKLIRPQIKTIFIVLGIFFFGALTFWVNPLSNQATLDPTLNHCGRLTYTSTLYPMRNILTEAHLDDLEVRNQMCWVRKMVSRVPQKFDSADELAAYNNLLTDRLMKPEYKFRASLPLIAMLHLQINMSAHFELGPKYLYDSVHFWLNHYTVEISQRQYSFWSWPHSKYIQFEYGLIERNWESLVDAIQISE